MTRYAAGQKPVVPRVHVPDMSPHCQSDGGRLKLFGRSSTTNPAGVLLAGVFSNRSLLVGRTPRKQFPYAVRERPDVFHIKFLPTFGRAFPSQSTSLGVGQALQFGSRERLFFDQHTLPLVALARTAETNDHCAKRRVAAASPSDRGGISTSKKHQMIEIGAR